MKSSGYYPLDGKVEVDELLIGGPEKDKRGRNKGEKKLVFIAVEKVKNSKIGWAYAQVIEQASAECFKPFFEEHIDSDNAKVFTNGWRGYLPLESEFEIKQKPSRGGKKLSRTSRSNYEFERLVERNSSSLLSKFYKWIFG